MHGQISKILAQCMLNTVYNSDDHYQFSAFPFPLSLQFSVPAFRFRFLFPPFPLAPFILCTRSVDLACTWYYYVIPCNPHSYGYSRTTLYSTVACKFATCRLAIAIVPRVLHYSTSLSNVNDP